MPGVSDPETTQESIQPNLAEFFSMKRKRRDDQAHTIGNPGACRLLLHDGHEGNPLKRDETRYVSGRARTRLLPISIDCYGLIVEGLNKDHAPTTRSFFDPSCLV